MALVGTKFWGQDLFSPLTKISGFKIIFTLPLVKPYNNPKAARPHHGSAIYLTMAVLIPQFLHLFRQILFFPGQ